MTTDFRAAADIAVHLDVSETVSPIGLFCIVDGFGTIKVNLTLAESGYLRKMLERAELAMRAIVDSHSEKGKET